MRRFGIASRIALIFLATPLVAQTLMVAAYVVERRRASDETTFAPLIGQIVALATLLGRTPADDRELVLRASTGAGFVPSYSAERPQIARTVVLGLVEQRLRTLLGGSPERFVALSLITNERRGSHPVRSLRDLSGARLEAVVELDTGGYLDVMYGGDITVRLLGLPIGLLAGIIGFLVALVALLAVRRETRPLTDLSQAVERFGTQLELQPVPERGAPDVRAVIQAVNTMQARIVDLVRTRTLVLGAISHDLRTYLTRLRLRMEFLPPSDQVAKAAADLDGMQALVDDALAFARASFSGASDEEVDLARLAQAERDARLAEGAEVTLEGAEAPRRVLGSPAALARVMANLVGNAIAYGGRADMRLGETGTEVELVVEDRGPGIPAAERASVFEPFYRLEPSRNRERGGAGLGLTIVKQIVEGHGGRVLMGDRPGGGASVRVLLPRAPKRGNG